MQQKHGHSLIDDLPLIEKKMLGRRKVLRLLTMSGTAALIGGCSGGSTDAAASSTDSATTSSTSKTTPATAPESTSSCIVDSTETNGPYPADGTNSSSGASSNVLTLSGAVRSDIRSSFINTNTVAPGTRLDLTIKLVNVKNACSALAGYAIYIWHCDAQGRYSLYGLPNESYLRGIQVTDGNGQLTFTTIVPGAYQGRYPHIHFEVFSSLAAAASGSGHGSLLVSQLAPGSAQLQDVYTDSSIYGSSAIRLLQTPLASDNVFGDNTAAQIAQQTIAMSGSKTTGYTGTVLIGINA
jgi:protocatechuate 3,4-dioxygenase beta subunit